ncbi:hypothetical protein SAMN05660742_111128 [Propionispira arboris]|uniref:Phage tail assembly chaperone protein, TAC n=1 Tax=Propionispira arboris TaxID=84035 RepID=A0A1H7AGY9_9FIRM|nr:hypothetical protein [Propionispira arboris]SEJ60295.1 hypothetical protein SAMN05660742_111128 [Propionispira arboris]
MKKTVQIKIDGKEKTIYFDIRRLAKLEQDIGTSILGVFRGGVVQKANINFTVAGLRNGLTENISVDEAFDTIEACCNAGSDIDEINSKLIEAILETGLFTPKKEEKNAVDETKQG